MSDPAWKALGAIWLVIGVGVFWIIVAVLLFVAGFILTTSVFAQHPPEHQELHEQFYSTWMIPPTRNGSCCSNHDCYPTEIRKSSGQWVYRHRETGSWKVIPTHKLEHNQTDPRDSPDGRSHVCATPVTGHVFCAVLGSGQ